MAEFSEKTKYQKFLLQKILSHTVCTIFQYLENATPYYGHNMFDYDLTPDFLKFKTHCYNKTPKKSEKNEKMKNVFFFIWVQSMIKSWKRVSFHQNVSKLYTLENCRWNCSKNLHLLIFDEPKCSIFCQIFVFDGFFKLWETA